jgi:superfamily I DNA and/or RNA helicase
MDNRINRLESLKKAIDTEFQHEKTIYEDTLKKLSVKELVDRGQIWYPLRINETGFTIGEYPYLTLEIAEDKLVSHQFKSGSIVRFFQNHDGDIHTHSVRGSIYYISNNQTKVILEEDDFPDWYQDGKIGIAADFDEKSFKEMRIALSEVEKADSNSFLGILRDKFYGLKPTHPIQSISFIPKNSALNASQIQAIEHILGMEDFLIIHGPPGTGKTTTLIEGIFQLAKREKQILVCSPSNSATDLLVEKLSSIGLKTLRIGNISRVNEAVLSQTLDAKMHASPEIIEIKKLRRKADEFRKMANKYKRQFGPEEREQRKLLLQEVKEIHKHIRWIEDYLVKKILEESQVICTTLVGSQQNYLKDIKFQTVVIDEVSQALEPATWIPILKAEKVILAGDPFQLPPTIKSPEAEKQGLSSTLMDIGFQVKNRVFLLDTQYRMKEEIMGFSNLVFYENKLIAAPNTKDHFFQIGETLYPTLQFIDTAGCGFDEKRHENSESLYNPEECKLLFDNLGKLLLELKYQYDHLSIGVIAPYRGQVEYMKNYDREFSQLKVSYNLDISTIDSFQGQERDIICISLVRSNDAGSIGFLKDYRRINVALTRAKKMLIVFGDSATLSQDDFYNRWLDYCNEHNAYKSAWEFMG